LGQDQEEEDGRELIDDRYLRQERRALASLHGVHVDDDLCDVLLEAEVVGEGTAELSLAKFFCELFARLRLWLVLHCCFALLCSAYIAGETWTRSSG
jgi:hypothetical protein